MCVRGHVPAQRCGLTRTWAKGYIYNCEHRIHLDVLKVFLVVLSHVPIHQASHPQDCAHEAQAVACKRSSGTVVACYNQDAWCCAADWARWLHVDWPSRLHGETCVLASTVSRIRCTIPRLSRSLLPLRLCKPQWPAGQSSRPRRFWASSRRSVNSETWVLNFFRSCAAA